MPIVPADLLWRLSGGTVNADPNASLGGIISNTAITDASLHNLFDQVSGAESSAGDIEYRGLYLLNNHATLALQNAFLWINSQTTSPDTDLAIALADEGLNTTMETIADESTAPVGPVFSAPASKGAGLSLGSIPGTQFYGIWARWTVNAAASAAASDNAIIQVEGDTAA